MPGDIAGKHSMSSVTHFKVNIYVATQYGSERQVIAASVCRTWGLALLVLLGGILRDDIQQQLPRYSYRRI